MRKLVYSITALSMCAGVAFTSCDSKPSSSQKAPEQSAGTPTAVETKSTATTDTTRLIGVWLDEALTWQKNQRVAYELISKNNKVYIQVITFAGKKLNVNDNPELSTTATELTKSGDKYISTDQPKAVYTFDKDGNMQVYDEKGLVMKCKRML